jgi:hypothetical protein
VKLTFLLGSGISRPAIPSVEELTNAVLTGTGIVDAVGGTCRGKDPNCDGEADHKAGVNMRTFLHWLRVQGSTRYVDYPERKINYEDIAYLAGQIADDIGYEYENPAIHPFVLKVLTDLQGFIPSIASRDGLRKLAKETVLYIRRTIIREIESQQKANDVCHLQFFVDACTDDAVQQVDLFTLNHDTLLEDCLRKTLNHDSFSLVDGLRDNDDGTWRWDPSIYEEAKRNGKRINIFKLHGSIDWKTCVLRSQGDERFIGTSTNGAYEIGEPIILMGTFDKMLRYHAQPFLELHYRFMHTLKDRNSLIVCGYSFGDKGVNTRIVEWMKSSVSNRLLIIDPAKSANLQSTARGAIQEIMRSISQILEDRPDAKFGPFDDYSDYKLTGNFTVKHLSQILENLKWKCVKRRIAGTNEEFLASDGRDTEK